MSADLPASPTPQPGPDGVPVVVRARPRRARSVSIVLAVLVVAMFTAIGTALRGPTDAGIGVFGTGDQVAMIILGVLIGLGVLALARPRVRADARHITIRNIIGGYDLPWDVVRAVRFDRGAPWASLDLHDDDIVAIMAVQAADKEYAVAAVRALRALLAAHRAATFPGGAADGPHGTTTDPGAVAGPDGPPTGPETGADQPAGGSR